MINSSPRARAFHLLHEAGCFVMPNPWDVGSARLLARRGFPALATTSAGVAWSLGQPDHHLTLEQSLAALRAISAAVEVPINADFEGGFAVSPDGVAANVTLAAETGIAGLSIEDATDDQANPLFDFGLAVDRIAAARRAIDESGTGIVLTARSEGFIVGRPHLEETLRRLRSYADAGADCLYAPGLRNMSEIAAVVREVAPKPVNVLVSGTAITVAELARAGVRRISLGAGLARVAWHGVQAAADEIARAGTFASLSVPAPSAVINALLA